MTTIAPTSIAPDLICQIMTGARIMGSHLSEDEARRAIADWNAYLSLKEQPESPEGYWYMQYAYLIEWDENTSRYACSKTTAYPKGAAEFLAAHPELLDEESTLAVATEVHS